MKIKFTKGNVLRSELSSPIGSIKQFYFPFKKKTNDVMNYTLWRNASSNKYDYNPIIVQILAVTETIIKSNFTDSKYELHHYLIQRRSPFTLLVPVVLFKFQLSKLPGKVDAYGTERYFA